MLRATELLKQAKLNSGKIYVILESLENKGLVSESIINNIRHFSAAPPTELLEFVTRKKKEITNEEKIIKSNLSSLKKMQNTGTKEVKAMTFTGLKGLKSVVYDIIENLPKDSEIQSMGLTKFKDKKFSDFWTKWSTTRIKKGIKVKMVFSEYGDYYELFKKMPLTKTKVLEGITPVAVNIFGGDKVMILNYTEPSTFTLIQDKNTVTSFKQFFEQLWKIAKP